MLLIKHVISSNLENDSERDNHSQRDIYCNKIETQLKPLTAYH